MSQITWVRWMFELSMIAYRGYGVTLPGELGDARVRAMVARGLKGSPTIDDRWQLAWGPARWQPAVGLFDDVLVYAVRDRQRPGRIAVAVRGTNPISALDWLFGDFWVHRTQPWPHGNDGARISYSTALGLRVVQLLRAEPASEGAGGIRWGALLDDAARLWRAPAAMLPRASASARARLASIRDRLQDEVASFAARRHGAEDAAAKVQRMLAEQRSAGWQAVLHSADDAVAELGEEASFDLLRLLEGDARLNAGFARGVDLLTWLRDEADRADGPLEVLVTGHSKGGALAQSVAMWLADTRGDDVDEGERWNPQRDRRATIGCYAFAGPTPGDAAFAARIDATLGARGHRIANHRDLVTHAWDPDDLREGPTLYDPDVLAIPGLDELAAQVCEAITPLRYRHAGPAVEEFTAPVDTDLRTFPAQVATQHSQRYVEHLGVEQEVQLASLFNPVR